MKDFNVEELQKMLKNKMAGLENVNFKEVLENAERMQKEMLPRIQNMAVEQEKISKPKDIKGLVFNNNNFTASLISDGRIMLNFSNTNDSEKYFNQLKSEQKGFFAKFNPFKK